MLEQFGEPTTESEAQALKRFLEQGAEVRLETVDRFEAEPTTLSIPEPVVVSFPGTEDLVSRIDEGNDIAILLKLEFPQHPFVPDFAIGLFVDMPAADASTSFEEQGFVASIAFFCHAEERDGVPYCVTHGDEPFRFQVPITSTLQDLNTEGEATVTLVPLPISEQQATRQDQDVTALIEVARSIVAQES